MSLKISNPRCLDTNNYEQLVIMQDSKTNNYIVNVQSTNKNSTPFFTKIEDSFFEKIKYFSDEVKILYIIKKFLDNNTISQVDTFYSFKDEKNMFTKVKGKSQILLFQMKNNPQLENECRNQCMKKYIQDREIFMKCVGTFVTHYDIVESPDVVCYEIYDNHLNGLIYFNLRLTDNKIWESDKKFLKNLIWNKLEEQGDFAKIEAKIFTLNGEKIYLCSDSKLVCGSLFIHIHSNRIREYVEQIVNEYNDSLAIMKKI